MSKKRAEVTLPALQVFLTLVTTRCMVSVVQRPGLPLNWVGGRRLSVDPGRSVHKIQVNNFTPVCYQRSYSLD